MALALLLLAAAAATNRTPAAAVVQTANGSLGCADVASHTRQCLGVPYAAPPLGPLRWRAPRNASAWPGVRPATKLQPVCIQGNRLPVRGQTDEDCLYLDIYSPRAPPKDPAGYPVVVWLHGGAYSEGSPQNATFLVDLAAGDGGGAQGVVWVGVNYRLNVFGFLGGDALRALDPGNGTGNYGLQDQRAALRWARANIQSFGGDPRKITIDGCSAGAGSTANHVTNVRSWPYFDQAAGQSGMLAQWNGRA